MHVCGGRYLFIEAQDSEDKTTKYSVRNGKDNLHYTTSRTRKHMTIDCQ